MHLEIFPDYSGLSRATADLITHYVQLKPRSLICFASGHSPVGVFNCLLEDVKNGRLNISQCTFVSLDEWLGMDGKQQGSCRQMMDETFFGPLKMDESKIVFFDGMASDPVNEADRVNKLIESSGGLDIMLVGVGTNGHIAMNEPGTDFSSRAHVSQLAEETIRVGQKYFEKETPLDKGITLGLGHFAESALPILIANGSKKAAIVQRLVEGPIGSEVPATIVRILPQCHVMIDQQAAALLKSALT